MNVTVNINAVQILMKIRIYVRKKCFWVRDWMIVDDMLGSVLYNSSKHKIWQVIDFNQMCFNKGHVSKSTLLQMDRVCSYWKGLDK